MVMLYVASRNLDLCESHFSALRLRRYGYRVDIKVMTPKLVEHFKLHHLLYMPPGLQAS